MAELPVEQFGLPVAGQGQWASCLRILNPLNGETVEFMEFEENEIAVRYFLSFIIALLSVNLKIILANDFLF